MNQTDRPIANPLVVLREEFDDWAVLFNPDTAEAVGINPVGVLIWKLLDGTCGLTKIAQKIETSFANVPATVMNDVKAFIDKLAERGFVGYELEDHADAA